MAKHTYESALEHLASIQSNRAVTSLFSSPSPTKTAPTIPSPSLTNTSLSTAQTLNNAAISEMTSDLAAAGITPTDLARLTCIHVSGTKGKGSVCAYLTALLSQPEIRARHGRVGTYTSPHLLSVRERIALDGIPISPDLFARYFFEVWDAFTAHARAEAERSEKKLGVGSGGQVDMRELEGPVSKPFYFRFLTILAFHIFLSEGVRSAVVECGIGGEYDSTNVLPPEAVSCAVVSQLGIDHVGMLGKSLPEIAWHKIGIAKPKRRVFTRKLTGSDGEAAMKVMRERTRDIPAELCELSDEDVKAWEGFMPGAGGLEGDFQRYNQALAACAVYEHIRFLETGPLSSTPKPPPKLSEIPEVFKRFEPTKLRGRCETVEEDNITWLIDGAHTAESLGEVAKWFASKQGPSNGTEVVLIFNQQERDAPELLKGLCDEIESTSTVFQRAIFTRNDLQQRTDGEPERDMNVQEATSKAMQNLSPGTCTIVCDNVTHAIEQVRKLGRNIPDRKVVVLATGSLHLVGAVLRILEPDSPI